MRKHLAIVNPVAGKGSGEKHLPRIEELLQRYGIEYDLVRTERPMHAAELALAAAGEGYETVISCGGDGTANEVINGLMRAKKKQTQIPAMALLCIGRGNDLAYGAGVPTGLEEACRVLAEGCTSARDVGLVSGGDFPEGRYFGNGIGVGFDTIVALEAAKMEWARGLVGYLLGALKTIFLYYKAPLVKIQYNGQEENKKTIQMSVMIGRRMGGMFFMTPKAINDDGLFDLCLGGEPRRIQMLGLIVQYIRGTQESSPWITTGRTPEIVLEALEGALVVHADGETISVEGKSLRIEGLLRQIQIHCPAEKLS